MDYITEQKMPSNLTANILLKYLDGKKLKEESIGLLKMYGEVIGERMVMLKSWDKIKVQD